MGKQEYFCTTSSFQCSDYFDFIVFLETGVTLSGLRMPPGLQNHALGVGGIHTALSNLSPVTGFCVCVAPEWLKPGSVQGTQEAPEQFWRVLRIRMRHYTAQHYSGTEPTSTSQLYPSEDLIIFCLTRISCPVQSHQKNILLLSTP